MDILGIGPLELIVILIVALAVFGPDKLPEIGSKLGRTMRDMRKATRAFSKEIDATRQAFEEPMREVGAPFVEASKAVQDISKAAAAVRNPGQALRDSVMSELKGPAGASEPTIRPPDAPAIETEVSPTPVEPAAEPSGDLTPIAQSDGTASEPNDGPAAETEVSPVTVEPVAEPSGDLTPPAQSDGTASEPIDEALEDAAPLESGADGDSRE